MVCMRNRVVPIVTVLTVLAATAPAFPQGQPGVIAGDSARAATLLADARAALGGEEKLAGVKTLELRGDFRRSAGNNQVEGEIELYIQAPDRMKRIEDTSLPGGGPAVVSTQVLNGATVWDENTGRGGAGGFGGGGFGRGGFGDGGRGGGGVRRGGGDAGAAAPAGAPPARGNIDPEALREAQRRQRQAELSRLLIAWLLASEAPSTWIGTAEAPDGTADVLEFRPADGAAATRLFLDSTSHLPLMITWQAAACRGRRGGDAAPVTQRMTLADYKDVGGIRLPHAITRGAGGQTTEEWSIDRYRVNQTFRPDTFEQKQ
jgi:hypothetical protein